MPAATAVPTSTGTTAAGSVRGRAPASHSFHPVGTGRGGLVVSLTSGSLPGRLSRVRDLVAVAIPGGPAFVPALRRIWDDGDAMLPLDPRLPAPAIERLLELMRPARLIDAAGDEHTRPGGQPIEEGDALVVPTSGSTGTPKGVVHTHASVAGSAAATSARLEVDPGRDRWLCCLPLAHVAGLSVVCRALHTDTPLEVHDGFDADAVMDAAARGATLTTLVPTALARIDPTPVPQARRRRIGPARRSSRPTPSSATG